MFVSFFPRPRLFFISAAVWSLVLVILWFLGGSQLGGSLGLASAPGGEPIIGPSRFLTADFVWFYLYFAIGIGLFYLFWAWFEPHPWQNWSILGSGLIIFVTNFSVQVSVALNDWRGVFYDMVQQALTTAGSVTPGRALSRRLAVPVARAGRHHGRRAQPVLRAATTSFAGAPR